MNLNFGIIGMGFIYPRHLEAIKHIGGEVTAVCDIDDKKLANAPEGAFVTNDWKTLIQHPKVKWVVICTPNHLHHRMIGEALSHNKNVIVEKPAFLDEHACDFFIQEGIKPPELNVVLQLRYHPEVERLKSSLNPYETHRVNMNITVRRSQRYWTEWKGDEEKSGGILYNLGVHYFDILLYLFGITVEVTHSFISQKEAIGSLEFANGRVKVSFHLEIVSEEMTLPSANKRSITIDGKETVFSEKDNLSFEGLHSKLYEEIIAGRGLSVSTAKPSLSLIKKIKSWQEKN